MVVPSYVVNARPRRRSVLQRLAVPSVLAVGGTSFAVAAVAVEGFAEAWTAAVLGAFVAVVGGAIVVQQRRLLWPGALLRLDDDGLHVRRGTGFVSLPWDRVAGVRVLPLVLRERAGSREVAALTWLPVDDRDVPVNALGAVERLLPVSPARARLTTLLNGGDRTATLLEVLGWVRTHQPGVEVLDAVCGTTVARTPGGDDVVVLAASGAWGPMPELVAALRAGGRRPVLLAGRQDATAPGADRVARALGAHTRWVDDTSERLGGDRLRVALSTAVGLVVVSREPGQTLAPVTAVDAGEVRSAMTGRPVVVVVRYPADLEALRERWPSGATFLVAPWVVARPATGLVGLSRTRPDAAVPIALADLSAVVLAVVGSPVDGVLHAAGGSEPVTDAVAGCAG